MQQCDRLLCAIMLLTFMSQAVFGVGPTPPPPPDVDFEVSVSGSSAFEEDNNVHTFVITKNGSYAGTVDFLFEGNASPGSDYIILGGFLTTGTLSFTADETSKSISVQCINNSVYEGPESIRLGLNNPTTPAPQTAGVGSPSWGSMIIADQTDRPVASFSVQGSPMDENGGQGKWTITLNGAFEPNIVVMLSIQGTATKMGPDKDYTHDGGMLQSFIFNPGESSKTVTFTAIQDDDDSETDETIIVSIAAAPQLQNSGGLSSTLYIEQQEPPTLSAIPDVTIKEDQTSDKISFRIGDDEDPVTSLRVFGRAEDKTLIPDEFTFSGDGTERSFRITPAPNQTGRTKGWIMVYDGTYWTSRFFYITVTGENDPPGPGENDPHPIVFDEDDADTLDLTLYVTDPDNQSSELRWKVEVKSDPPESENVKEKEIKLCTLSTIYESYYVVFGEEVPVNSTLLDTSLSDNWVVVPQGTPLPGNVSNDTIWVNQLNEVNGLYVSIIRATAETFFYGSPDFNDPEIPLLLTATDPSGGSYSFSLTVTINPVNDAPVLENPLPAAEAIAGEMLVPDWGILDYTEDVDNNPNELVFTVQGSDHVAATLHADTLVIVSEANWTGVETITVIVSDGDLSDTSSCEVTVAASNGSEGLTSVNFKGGVPTEYALDKNYPNPFNPVTTMAYAIPKESHVKISVYNIMGQIIDVLVDENKGPGFYTQTWNGGNQSSGLYFYEIQADGFHAIQRCILMK